MHAQDNYFDSDSTWTREELPDSSAWTFLCSLELEKKSGMRSAQQTEQKFNITTSIASLYSKAFLSALQWS